jgi:tetratricopeptide (TPR) repeat protein
LTHFDLDNLDRALDDFQRALDLRYDSPQLVYQMQGWTYFHKGDYDRATSAFRQALDVDSQLANAYWGLGDVSRQLGDFDQAVEYYLQYIYIARDEARPEIVAYVNGYMGEPRPSSGGSGANTGMVVLGTALLSIIGIWVRWRIVKGQWSAIQERNRKPKQQRVEEQIAFSEKRKS